MSKKLKTTCNNCKTKSADLLFVQLADNYMLCQMCVQIAYTILMVKLAGPKKD